MKKLSIIIPVYNVEKYLSECIESIIISKKNFEVILIDDGSTDNSSNICDEYAKLDKRIKVFHKENGGVSSARNVGINKSSGDYITFVDSDDKLSKEWDNICNYIDYDDIYFYSTMIKNNVNKNNMLKYITGTNKEHIYLSGVNSKIFKRKTIIENDLKFNEQIINGEDMLFNIEAILISNSYKIIGVNYYCYRQFLGQATRKYDNRIISSDLMFHKCLNEIFIKYNVNKSIASDIKNNCLVNAVLLLLNRISYIDSFKEAKKYYDFLYIEPYNSIICTNGRFIFRLCKGKKYKLIYSYFKIKSKLSIIIKYRKKSEFIEI